MIPLLGVYNTFDEIDFNKLPNRFVIKTNHGAGWNIIVKNKDKFNKADARLKINEWMNKNFAFTFGLELHYKNIVPKIIVESYIENESGGDLYDYKIFCFNGKAKYIMFLAERQNGLKMAFYDLDWNMLPFTYSYPQYTVPVAKPKKLREMIKIAENLAEGFYHVRVDLYYLDDDSIKFGEMTFTSFSGICKWNPPEYNEILGRDIELPVLKQ